MLKRILIFTLLSLGITLPVAERVMATTDSYESAIDIVATISGRVITSQDLMDRAEVVAILNNVGYHDVLGMRDQLLEAMIDEKLLLQEGENKGISVNDAQVDYAIRTVNERHTIASSKFEQLVLKNPQKLANIKEQVKAQLILKELLDSRKVSFSRRELEEGQFILPYIKQQVQAAKAQYQRESTRERINNKTEVLLREIILPANASNDEVIEAINSNTKVTGGQSSATKYDGKGAKVEMRDLGWLKLSDLSEIYRSAVLETMVDNISQPLIGDNFMIILPARDWRNLSPVQKNNQVDQMEGLEDEERLNMALFEAKNDRIHQDILHSLRKKYLIEIKRG